MTYDELVELVGSDRYRAACECAWERPRGETWPDELDIRVALDAAETDVFGQSDPKAAEAWRRRLGLRAIDQP